jgi:RES domain-containing protein
MRTVWRITKQKHTDTAFTGEGARLYGGRWNSPGRAVVYTAGSQALAALELLVHLDAAALLLQYVLIEVKLPADAEITESGPALAPEWRSDPPSTGSQQVGDQWLAEGRTLALKVPSVLIPGPEEGNYLINPEHADFKRCKIGRAIPFVFDERLR